MYHSRKSPQMFKSTDALTDLPEKHAHLTRFHQQAWVYSMKKKNLTQCQFPKAQGQISQL